MDSIQTPKTAIQNPDALAGFYCPECGYDLRGLAGERCPECGFALALVRDLESHIPWARRRQIGFFRAYWRTVWNVMFRHKEFCREMFRPQSYSAARGFQFVTVLHVFAAFVIGAGYFALFGWNDFKRALDEFGVVMPSVVLGCVFLYFFALAGLPSYFFHPRALPVEQQNRAIVLSYYACAPLAWLPLPVAVLVPIVTKMSENYHRFMSTMELLWMGLMLLTFLSPVALVLAYWLTLIRTASKALRNGTRTLLVTLAVPALWLLLGALILVGVPGVVFYVLVVAHSLGG